ncbi:MULTISPECIES: hypothetical protein [unclassified Chryseobacterium]|uniref:hypothetical protein n=1 Tax=unclassified Chryseobacterium TaxID=2593645 RepID=UPI000F4545EF|nr:hypothetical protein [Chryseobacterium sp. G0240]ROH98928.1 hypothetical protein EGI16_20470 [Chryseobacterium sp. G0240]
MKEFDIEKLERKNIYTVPDNLFESIQGKVMNDIKTSKKAPVFKLNWMYAAAASLALIFGATYVFNSDNDSVEKGLNSKEVYTVNSNKGEPKTEGELAYETLKSDLTSVENNNQTVENQENNKSYVAKTTRDNTAKSAEPVKTATKKEETRMNDYLDSFSNSEIAELASNSTQDVYLDLYN